MKEIIITAYFNGEFVHFGGVVVMELSFIKHGVCVCVILVQVCVTWSQMRIVLLS